MVGRIGGIRLKGKLTLEIDQEVSPDLLSRLLGGGRDEMEECYDEIPYPPSEGFQVPLHPYLQAQRYPYTGSQYPISAGIADYPQQYLSPPQ